MRKLLLICIYITLIVLSTITIFTVYHFKNNTDIIIEAISKQKEFNNKSNYILYIDLDKPIFLPRLYVIDKKSNKIIKRNFVFTSYKSGLIYTTKFSNTAHSNITSKGAFKILNDYSGRFGYSVRIQGLESHNNNVLNRAIVLHPWMGFPYTQGCYSTTKKTLNEIIPLLKNGSFMYVN